MTDLICPCCGKEFEGEYMPAEWLPLAVSGSTAQLVVKALRRGIGHWMRADQLAAQVYGNSELEAPEQGIRVHIHRMRPMLERAGWQIEGKNQTGYRLTPRGIAS